jgi:hypothetical protein
MNGKHVVIALVLMAGIVAAALACQAMIGGGLYTSGPAKETVAITGTVVFVDLEGGFYGIAADDGTRYLPLDLPGEFAQDGLPVTAEVVVKEDVATIQQWGTPVEIIAIASNGQASAKIAVP